MKKKILVFGIVGFSGHHFLSFFKKRALFDSYDIYGVDKQPFQHEQVHFFQMDLIDSKNIENILKEIQPDYILNLTGLFGSSNFNDLIDVNLKIPTSILNYYSLNSSKYPKKILLIGSAAEYGLIGNNPIKENSELRPVSPYGVSKVMQSLLFTYFSSQNLPVCLVRPFNIIGSDISSKLAIGAFYQKIKNAKDGDTITTGNLTAKRDYLGIEDIIEGYWAILLNGVPGQVYNLCSSIPISMEEILNLMIYHSNKQIFVQINPELGSKFDVPEIYGDNSKIKKELGWSEHSNLNLNIKSLFK